LPKIIIQIAYSATNLDERAHTLKDQGHEVISMLGNSDALRQRDQFEHADVVVLGHAADLTVRKKMVLWLKQNYPGLRIVALHNDDQISEADVNVRTGSDRELLAAVNGEIGPSSHRVIR
jgi:hypothetical protein